MKNLLVAAAAVGLIATTSVAFVGEARAQLSHVGIAHGRSARAGYFAHKHPACVLPVPDNYLQSFRDRYECWNYPYPYFVTHKPWYGLTPYVWAGVNWGPYWRGRAP
jgi:hypothetical protein